MNSSSSSGPHFMDFCSSSGVGPVIRLSSAVVKPILIVPLSILVLYLGLQRRQKQKSLTHSEVFTYHLAAVELFWAPGLICNVCGTYLQRITLITVAGSLYSFTFYGEAFFHILTCVDRYLAVVHPIIYRRLRNSRGMKIRNISISCSWILSLGLVCFYIDTTRRLVVISMLCFVGLPIIVITYCTLSVLCALIRPRPGEGGGEKERVDQLKRRAFHTITSILGVLSLWFFGLLSGTAFTQEDSVHTNVKCMISTWVIWFSVPTSLVSPLLYLHRSRKLVFICRNRVK